MITKYAVREIQMTAVVVLELEDDVQAGHPFIVLDVSDVGALDDVALHTAITSALNLGGQAPGAPKAKAPPFGGSWIDAQQPAPVVVP